VLKKHLEGLVNYPEVFVIMATNKIHLIDPEILVPKRVERIDMLLPDSAAIKGMFVKLLFEEDGDVLAMLQQLDTYDLDALATEAKEHDFSGSDVQQVIINVRERLGLEARRTKSAPRNPTQVELLEELHTIRLQKR
jgi:SpoVK/Ycf46/Vps4 family AAA+-type ATPase